MNRIKKYIGGLALLSFGLISQAHSQNIEYSLCKGGAVVLEAKQFIAGSDEKPVSGSVFIWTKGGAALTETSNKLNVLWENAEDQKIETYKCILKKDGIEFGNVSFKVTFNPNPVVDILANNLCEHQMASFTYTNSTDIVSQTWTIDDVFVSQRNTVDYLCGKKAVKVKLKVESRFGCSFEVEKTFQVGLDPKGIITKSKVNISENYFIDHVDCGNSLAEYEVKELKTEKVTKWKILVNNSLTSTKSVIVNGVELIYDSKFISEINPGGNKISVKWSKQTSSNEINIQAYYSNTSCENWTEYKTILIKDNSPEKGDVFQKPNSANILIFPSGKGVENLNFQWGYTDQNGDHFIAKNDRYYCELDGSNLLNPAIIYWVETWYATSDICRTRNLMKEKVKLVNTSKSISLQLFPNPATDQLHVAIANPVNGKLQVSDLNGILMLSVPVDQTSNKTTLDISSLKCGNYVVVYKDGSDQLISSGNIIVN